MGDYAPPSGPPPPRVPEGWKAQWNSEYSEWFYVNIYTKQSQWEKPIEPVHPPSESGTPPGPPPSHGPGERTYPAGATAGDSGQTYPSEKLGTNNPYSHGQPTGSNQNIDEDARLAAKLQAEEDARASQRGASDSYYQSGNTGSQPPPQSYDQQQLPPRESGKKGGLGGLLSKFGKHSSPQHQQQGYGGAPYGGQPQYAQQGGYPPQTGYGGYPPQQGYGGGYGGPPPGAYGGGYQQMPAKKQGGGLGTAGGAALGLGGGLVGGALLANAFDGGDGGDGGGDGGGNYGGDDGGDGGGDFGGGDDGGGGGDF